MGKNKLKKFAEMQTFSCVFQYPWAVLQRDGFALRGNWNKEYFKNDNPIVLELGCGKGEYTVGLARQYPDKNFIGIDIKGARIWTGAKTAETEGLKNVAFLRTGIELIESFFTEAEVAEIWITFPDPQMQKTRRRLTSTRFLNLYRHILCSDGTVHLKTDSPFLYTYTDRLVTINNFPIKVNTNDLYAGDFVDPILSIKTFYEQQWLSRGKKIKYISFTLPKEGELIEPQEDDIEHDDYHSYQRGVAQGMIQDDNL